MKMLKDKTKQGKLDTYIGEETSFEGSLISRKSLTIYGNVKGTIECQGRVVTGESGEVEADILANEIMISGKVLGDIIAKSKLEITSSGVIQDDIKTARLLMQDGSKLDGNCEMLPDDGSKAVKRTEAKSIPATLAPQANPELPSKI
jgi:cytoskeletal protein CcmA (bactofilin family)